VLIRVAPGHGPDAIADAIASMGSDRTLVLHDDIEIDAHSVAALLTTSVVTRGLALPAEEQGGAQRPIARGSLACVVGPGDRLADLARQLAFTPGIALDVADATVAARTGHRHLGTCAHQLAGPDPDDGRPLLVAALIVRNEALMLGDCLASLEGIVDRIEIADTGSTDDTISIAEAAGAQVSRIGWRDDFAWARNQVLERCRDAHHVLMIDADERLVCQDPITLRRFLNTQSGTHRAYGLRIDNRSDGAVTHSHRGTRLFVPSEVQYAGALHEQVTRDGQVVASIELDLCSLDHVGYDAAVVAARDKRSRNLALARTAWEAAPDHDHAVRYYRELAADVAHPDRTLAEMDRVLHDLAVVADPAMRASLYALRGRVHLAAGDTVAALVAGREASDLCPADSVAGAVLIESLVRLGRHREALDAAVELDLRPSASPVTEDHVAAATRAHALFRAALAVGSADDALAQLPNLPSDLDPWPMLAEALDDRALGDAAAVAAGLGDPRCIALAMTEPLTAEAVAIVRDRYAAAGGDLVAADAAAEAMAASRSWELARVRFEAAGTVEAVLAYARVTAVDLPQIAGELDVYDDASSAIASTAVGSDDRAAAQATASALSVAAAAHLHAGRSDMAVADAVAAVEYWPGALRAAAIAANAAVDADMTGVALELIVAARAAVADTEDLIAPIDPAVRHELADAAVRAHLRAGSVGAAAGEALAVIEERGRLGCWAELLDAADGDDQHLALVIGLALLSDGEDFVATLARTRRAQRTAELCLAYLASGGAQPAAVSTGVLAAAIAERTDLAVLVADHGALLAPDTARRIAGKLRDRGNTDVAGRIEKEAGLLTTAVAPDPVSGGFGSGLDGGFTLG